MSTAFGSLREYNEFSDVTLACEDGQQIEAHKVILIASSPFFLSLLRRNNHAHPLIYMRGMDFADLKAILDYIYCGEATIDKTYRFLSIAEEFKLDGLKGECLNETDAYSNKNPPTPKTNHVKQKSILVKLDDNKSGNNEAFHPKVQFLEDAQEVQRLHKEVTNEVEMIFNPTLTTPKLNSVKTKEISLGAHVDMSESQAIPEWSKASCMENFRGDLKEVKDLDRKVMSVIVQELDQKVLSMMELGQNMLPSGRKTSVCKVCGRESQNSSIKDHIEVHHIDGIILPCHFCSKTFSSRASLKRHKFHQH